VSRLADTAIGSIAKLSRTGDNPSCLATAAVAATIAATAAIAAIAIIAIVVVVVVVDVWFTPASFDAVVRS
jgi:TctA family transporter